MSNVLIVEDYESIKNLYAGAFERAGFKVETATSGQDALTKTKGHEFDAIILDMLMLELSGMDFLKNFDAAKHPRAKVIVVSNLDSPNVMERAKALGVVDYLIKSQYTPEQIVDIVRARLEL